VKRVLHLIPSVGRQSYGLGTVVLNLVGNQRPLLDSVHIWSTDSEDEIAWATDSTGLPQGVIKGFPAKEAFGFGYSLPMRHEISGHKPAEFDVVHQHGIWTGISLITSQWRKITGLPTVVTPHGALDQWALKKSSWKKHIASFLYEYDNLQTSCLHALSAREAESFRSYGLNSPIAVIPNGISESWIRAKTDPTSFRHKFGIDLDARILLFLGRITPKKGLPLLLRSMAELRNELNGWRLVIAGADEFGHQREVNSLVSELQIQDCVQIIGSVFDQDKRNAFSAASLFVLPSYSEGSPMVVLEALGAGVPVIATQASPWEELVTKNCGWWPPIDEAALVDALGEALAKNEFELEIMGAAGKGLVQDNYLWTEIAQKTVQLYEWLMSIGPMPEFVIRG